MPLIRALKRSSLSEDVRARLAAVRDAMEANSAQELATLLIGEADGFVRETALTHLARLDGEFPAQALVRLMREGDTALRNAAIETLGSLGERAIDALAGVLVDADVDARIYALTALQLIESPRAAEVALDAALKDADVNVCAAAIDVVAESGARAMAAALSEVAARFPDRPYIAFAAHAAQHRLG
jgi:HEAT repeat protein